MEFAQIIRSHRERLGLNKKQLAARVQVTQPYIVQIENDGRVPADAVVLRLADTLGLSRRELLFAAYKARASDDTRHYFHSIFDDLTPTETFSQPFIEARKNQFESPDFSLTHLTTSEDGAYQVALLTAKTGDAVFSTHAHSVPQILVAVDGTFEVEIAGAARLLSPGGEISALVPARTAHKIVARTPGRLLTVTLGRVVRRDGAATSSRTAGASPPVA